MKSIASAIPATYEVLYVNKSGLDNPAENARYYGLSGLYYIGHYILYYIDPPACGFGSTYRCWAMRVAAPDAKARAEHFLLTS